MSKTVAVVIGGGLVIAGLIGYTVSAKFTAAKYENAIFAQNESMQSTWGMLQQSLKMQGFTVKAYGKTFIDSIEANAKRYENDKGGMMKWVQEAQSQMSPELHSKFMTTVEKAYARKEAKQLSKISVAQEYRNYSDATLKGLVSNVVWSYPTAKATKIMDTIITTKETKTTFDTGIEADVSDPFAS